MTLDGVLNESEKSIQDLGESTPVNFAWDTQIYTANQGPEPEPEPDFFLGRAGGDGDDDGDSGAGGGGGESEGAGGGLDWTVGRFGVFSNGFVESRSSSCWQDRRVPRWGGGEKSST